MRLGWYLIPALLGYWWLTRLHVTSLLVLRKSGYHLFFLSGLTGFVVCAAWLLAIHGFRWWQGFPLPEFTSVDSLPAFLPQTAWGLIANSIAILSLPFVLNLVLYFCKDKAARYAAHKNGDLIELLLAEAMEQRRLVEISLASGKSYIGHVLVSGIECSTDSDIKLLPLASGHRCKEKQELRITLRYPSHAWSYHPDLAATMQAAKIYQVVIPISDVVSARFFDFQTYEMFRMENAHKGDEAYGDLGQ